MKGAFVILTFVLNGLVAGPVNERSKMQHAPLLTDLVPDQEAEASRLHADVTQSAAILGQSTRELAEVRPATDHSLELDGGHQTFFPSFASLFEPRQQSLRLGYNNNQETAYSQRPNSFRSILSYPLFSGYRSLDGFSKQNSQTHANLVDANSGILGSGNFGVIKGGTFFGQSEGESDSTDGFNYYNSHGSPQTASYTSNPRPNYNQDQFANFRDFADINTPSSAFSEFVVVYANKNSTIAEVKEKTQKRMSEPKNIIETLELLDQAEKAHEIKKKQPKLSKSKAKLAKTKTEKKKEQLKKSKPYNSHKAEPDEPLLALS